MQALWGRGESYVTDITGGPALANFDIPVLYMLSPYAEFTLALPVEPVLAIMVTTA